MQLSLFNDSPLGQQYLVRNVPTSKCRISRYNTRKTRDPETIAKLAERIRRNGFELTRALWVYEADAGMYEVFAGGNRLMAAEQAGATVHLIVHKGYSWEHISRLADQDNENDEYHHPVSLPDVWAEYARLRDEEGWTQKRIAEAKGVHPTTVGERIKWNALPANIKGYVRDTNSLISEGHLRPVFAEIQTFVFPATDDDLQALRIEYIETAAQKKWSVRQLTDQWQRMVTAIDNANAKADMLAEEADEYTYSADGIQRVSVNWRQAFADMLAEANVRTSAEVDKVFSAVVKRQDDSKARKDAYDRKLDAEAQAAEEEARRIGELMDRWQHGDCLQLIPTLPDGSVRLLLTDPPYGMAFQSNRRVASGKAEAIDNDGDVETAVKLFASMIAELMPKLEEEAHLLVFTHWRMESDFRRVLETAGYTIRGSLIWVKNNHSSGDLEGAFAPKHERIIHATKGRPAVKPRKPDVFTYAADGNSNHPTEKPVELLKTLIESTTTAGQLVVDPFGGVASTMVAAKALARDFWGCELSKEWWADGLERLK